MMKKRRSQLIFSLLAKTLILKKSSIDFKWSVVQEEDEEYISKANFIKISKWKLKLKFSQKVTQWLFDDYELYPKKRKIKKNYFKVISNIKNFNIKFFLKKLPTTKIYQIYIETIQSGNFTALNMVPQLYLIYDKLK